MIQRSIYGLVLVVSLLFALATPTNNPSTQASSLTVLITGQSNNLLSQVEQGFVKNLPASLLQGVRFIREELSSVLSKLLLQSAYLTGYDLIIAPRSAPVTLFEPIANHLKALANPADLRLAIIDAGLVYVTILRGIPRVGSEELVGAEVPWQPDFVISITTDPSRGRVQAAISFLQGIGQNVFVFVLGGETISVKSLLLENKTPRLAFGVHLEFDREPGAAAAAGRQDWSCRVQGKEAICETAVDSVPQGGRLATGVAFLGTLPGRVKNCWWADRSRELINYC